MPNPTITVKPKETSRLSKVSAAVSIAAGCLLMALLVIVCVKANFVLKRVRTDSGVVTVEDYVCREIEKADTPIGVIKEYTFSLSDMSAADTNLAFYTVHQYVDVYLEGQHIYSLKPSEEQFVKTIGSNWSMIPLYREDAGKEIRVEITPVYESFRNRQVEFLIGSRYEIYVGQRVKDLPQIVLSILAIFVGIVFLGIAVYRQLRKSGGGNLAAFGLVSIMMGLWRLADTRFTPFLMPQKPVFLFCVSVGVLMIGLVPLIKSMQWRFNPISRRILDWCRIGTSVICLVLVLLQMFGGVDLRENLPVIHITLGAGAAIFIGSAVFDRLKYPGNRENVFSQKEPLILAVGVLADIVAFYVKGNSSGLLFTLLAMLIYSLMIGYAMMMGFVQQEIQLAEKDRILAEQERQLTESRIATMVSQIRPHFIYNTLGSIEQLCELQPETAAKLVHDFSCYLRGNFGEMDNPAPIPLSQEMKHVEHYVSIEQIRFPDIEVQFDIRSGDFLIPALSVQPLVENAIKHGLMKLPQGGTVTVSSYETDSHAFVSVEDNGVGFDTEILLDERKHIGLRNIRTRIEVMCGGTLTVESTPGVGTKVWISIPKEAET